jgi:two-component sensor histidine kinase
MRLPEVKNPLLEVIKHADLHCMEEVGLQEVTHDTENLLKMVESLVNMTQREFRIDCLGFGITVRSL